MKLSQRVLFNRITSGMLSILLVVGTVLNPVTMLPAFATASFVKLNYENHDKNAVELYVQAEEVNYKPGDEMELTLYVQNNSEEALSGVGLSWNGDEDAFEEAEFIGYEELEAELNEKGNVVNLNLEAGEIVSLGFVGTLADDLEDLNRREISFFYGAETESGANVTDRTSFEFTVGLFNELSMEFADGNELALGETGTIDVKLSLNDLGYYYEAEVEEDEEIAEVATDSNTVIASDSNTEVVTASDSDAEVATDSNSEKEEEDAEVATDSNTEDAVEIASDSDSEEEDDDEYVFEITDIELNMDTYGAKFKNAKVKHATVADGKAEVEATIEFEMDDDAELGEYFGTLQAAITSDKKVYNAEIGFQYEVVDELITTGFKKHGLFTAELDNFTVNVQVPKGAFDEKVELSVTELAEDSEEFKEAEEAMANHGRQYDGMMALDICFLNEDGEEVEPKEGCNVQVSIEMNDSLFPENTNHNTVSVEHLKENENGTIKLEQVADTADITAGTVAKEDSSADTTIAEFSVDNFSTFAISWQALPASYTSYTVTFNVGEKAAEAGVVVPEPVVTSEETGTVESLPTPVWNDENGNPVHSFGGWYYNGDEFDTATVVENDIEVVAKWVSITDDSYHVNFYNETGDVVLLTVAVEEGYTVSSADAPELEKKVFIDWSINMQSNSSVETIQAFDFTRPVSEVLIDTKTLNLYAWYANAVSVSFVTNGGIAVPTEIIVSGSSVEEPVTTREGYDFIGWSTNQDTYIPFNFNTELTEDITLYAFWKAKIVPVKLVYMYENADDDNYTPAGISQTVYAPVGSYISIDKSNITRLNQTHTLKYSLTSGGEFVGNVRQTANGNTAATIPDISDTYYQYNSASNNRLVMPDGSTVVLVYYNRARVTLTFTYTTTAETDRDSRIDRNEDEYPNGNTASMQDEIDKMAQTTKDKYSVVYTPSTSGRLKFTYSFTAKYGQSITDVWPQIGWVTNNSSSGRTFYTWRCPDDHDQSSNMYTLEASLFNEINIVNNVLVGTGNLWAKATSVSVDWLIYARTTLPGEVADFTYNGKSYTIYTEACQKAYSYDGYGYKTLEGCTAISGKPQWHDEYSDLKTKTSFSTDGKTVQVADSKKTIKSIFNDTFGSSNIANDDRCQILLYDRNKITLSLHTNDDVYKTNAPSEEYLYGDWIYNGSASAPDLLQEVESKMSKEGYTFAGWYTDPDFVDGTQYEPTADSRIYANMELYAKWDSSQYKAEFYLYTDDNTPYREEGFKEGERLTNWLVPQEAQASFVGWYWYQDGKLQPFDFTSTVGANHVDEDGILKLYAVWKGTIGKVQYLPGEGGDNIDQAEMDSRDFIINEASVQLEAPNKVWTDGTVPDQSELVFVGWKAPNGAIYQPGRYALVTRALMQFEAQWTTDAVKLIYDANGGDGSKVTETWERDSVVDIWDNMDNTVPHFTRVGYELIGWDTEADATKPDYEIGEGTITLEADTTTLYAIWKRSTAELTVEKQVAGNMGDWNKKFTFTVTYGGTSETMELKHGESGKIIIPCGAEVTVTETPVDNYNFSVQSVTGLGAGDYNKNVEEMTISFVMPEESVTVVIKNTNDATPDTGISMDTLPYILILLAVIGGVVFTVIRKRKEDDLD